MRFSDFSVLALSASAVSARFHEKTETNQVVLNAEAEASQQYLIELAPGETLWVTEEDKWELRRVRLMISDV